MMGNSDILENKDAYMLQYTKVISRHIEESGNLNEEKRMKAKERGKKMLKRVFITGFFFFS